MNYLFLIIVLVIVLGVLGVAMFTDFELDDEHYDRLKWIVLRWAYLVTFIGLIAKTFDIPYGIETVTIVGGIGAMLAGLLGISNKQYESRQVSEDEYDDEDYEEDDDEGEE